MLKPIEKRQQDLIVKNIVAACKDISKLNRTGYNYIYLASGFIAHYDLFGFQHYYSYNSLKADILRHYQWNRWLNFRPGEENYEYYQSKAKVYQAIVDALTGGVK